MRELYNKKLNLTLQPEIMKWLGMPLEIVMLKGSACCSVYTKEI
jgi:hypothetical protein